MKTSHLGKREAHLKKRGPRLSGLEVSIQALQPNLRDNFP